MQEYKYVAPCLFGVEGILSFELERMGAKDVKAENGRVNFAGDLNILARANINSRFAERILINVGEFDALSFEELFQGVKALPWEEFIGKDDAFPVNGHSINSALHSIPDCQNITLPGFPKRVQK